MAAGNTFSSWQNLTLLHKHGDARDGRPCALNQNFRRTAGRRGGASTSGEGYLTENSAKRGWRQTARRSTLKKITAAVTLQVNEVELAGLVTSEQCRRHDGWAHGKRAVG